MRRRTWGLVFLLAGLLVAAGGVAGAFAARKAWSEARAECAGSADDWCGGGRTYLAALGLALAPLAIVAGMLGVAIGVTVLAFRTPRARGPPDGFV